MESLKLHFKKIHSDAVTPSYAKIGDAGVDLTAVDSYIDEYGLYVYYTGLAVEIPEGYVGLIFPRSSLSKYDLVLANHVGVIDSGYRGQIMVKFRATCDDPKRYTCGDRICQLMIVPIPTVEFEEVDELSESERGEGGFGSSGK